MSKEVGAGGRFDIFLDSAMVDLEIWKSYSVFTVINHA